MLLNYLIKGEFQFPSNGKDFPNKNPKSGDTLKVTVSIPFKREGLSEPKSNQNTLYQPTSGFNSLQTGRTFRTYNDHLGISGVIVSIPFKREGLSEPRNRAGQAGSHSFNSLQTGRTFRTLPAAWHAYMAVIKFQFPSNGKDFPNSSSVMLRSRYRFLSFNSLQTGRTFRTHHPWREYLCRLIWFQFPSNGKDFPN